jgi:glycosyltransferase involved in cell wall biosynthesis
MKGIKDAIMAISFLKNWRLIVVGIGKPDYESELKNMAIKLNLAKRVEFRGFVPQPEKFKLYSQSWVLLAPSSREGWGMTIPEANSVGTPAIGYNVPGLREVLPYYSPTNRLIDPNPTALASTLIKFNMPIKAINVPFPGWNELEKFVSKKDF